MALGKDISEMGGQLKVLISNTSDIENYEKRAKQPTLVQSIFNSGNVEKVALDSFIAKKQLEKQRHELKMLIMGQYGQSGWNELLATEGQIRKDRQQFIYARQQQRDKIINYCAIFLLVCTVIGFIVFLAYLYKIKN